MKTRSTFFPARRWALAFSLALAGDVHAADIFWGGTSGSWATLSNWSTDPDNATPNPIAVPAGGDELFFNISSVNANTVIDLTANRNTEKLIFSNTGTTGFRANTSGTTARLLSINPRGILMNAGAGAVTFGVSSGTNGRVDLSFNAATNSITNDSSSNLNINNRVQSTVGGGTTITNNGTGTNYVGMGDLRSTVAKIVQDSATSTLGLRQNNSTFTGTVEILKGMVSIGTSANNFGTFAGQVLFGASFGSDAATIEINDNSSQTYAAKPIVLGGTSGLLKIVLRDDSGTNTHTITGAISGNNNLILENQDGDDKLTFNTGGLNNVGTITHIGAGAGDLTINSVIGTDVTGVIQNSTTSPLVLNGTNTYTGATTVGAGTLTLGASGSIADSASVSIAAGATLDASSQAIYVIPASQPVEFGIDATGSGSSGKIAAAGLDISNATVTYNMAGPLDDAVYVLATYTAGNLTGTFLSAPAAPAGYELKYDHEGDKIALVQVAVPGFAAWQAANSTAGGLGGDHDNDGVDNGIEWFLGGNNNTTGFTTPLPDVTNTGGAPSVTWVRHPDYPGFPGNYGTAFRVETSATLDNPWTPAAIGVGAGFVEITGDSVKFTFPAGVRNFARLVVTGP